MLGPSYKLFYQHPVHVVRGEGCWLYDAEGNAYLDVYNNVPSVGHCHPRVVEAVSRQAATLNTHTRYLHEAILEYGERLTATFDRTLTMAHFCCSGTEASELALRIAKACTGNEGVIVTDFCYHGNSATIAALSTAFPVPEGVGANVRTITVPDPYRPRDGIDPAKLATGPQSLEAFVEFIPLTAPEGEPLKLELQSFVDAVRGRGPVVVSGQDGREALAVAHRIMEAIDASLAMSGTASRSAGARSA